MCSSDLVGGWLVNSLAEVVPEQPVLQLVTGGGETGQALALSAVDKIAFTGSAATARKVMAACAENLTPMVAECGGKDALLVGADADLDAAADAAAWGALSNAGQTCVGVERAYAVDEVYHTFLEKLAERAAAVRPGEDREADYGPMTMPGQIEIIEGHIADALARGGRPVIGGLASIRRPYVGPVILADVPEESRAVSEETFGPMLTVTRVGDRYAQPTVLIDVPEDSEAVTEETFGPTVTIAKVRDMDEAIEKANSTKYGLGSTVFSKSRGVELAGRLRTGMTAINAPLSFAGIASLPFGGVGDSGFGRIHGPEGLREFARTKAIARQRFTAPMTLTSFSRKPSTDALVAKLVTILHGKR